MAQEATLNNTLHLAPGMRVRHPQQPDWGIGQIQSVIGDRVTVNFEHAGKLLIIASQVMLDVVGDDDRAR
ncbi:MAG TPA: DUF3553 domain-containing protein [Kiloniellaceae bacterium]